MVLIIGDYFSGVHKITNTELYKARRVIMSDMKLAIKEIGEDIII